MRVILVKQCSTIAAYVWHEGALCPLDLWEQLQLEALFALYEREAERSLRVMRKVTLA